MKRALLLLPLLLSAMLLCHPGSALAPAAKADAPTTPPVASEDVVTTGLLLTGEGYTGVVPAADQQAAAQGVVRRLLGERHAAHFRVEIVPAAKDGADFFEVEPAGDHIVLRGPNGVSALRGLKWYLNEKCHSSISWRGDNLSLPDPLPRGFAKHREATPYPVRYIFNNCVYGYTMPWWKWADWERMLDVLAFNGVNMPAMLLGQEKIWQETYKELGYSTKDLEDFFAGPAWYPWQWMGNLNGWGGPVPQSVVDAQSELQKRILSRARVLGMRTVLPGFSGHIPKVLVDRNPDLKYHTMEWWGFGPTHILDWQDPAFRRISSVFMRKQREAYGTDHLYNIDPFNEMTPPKSDEEYLASMARTIFKCIDEADPKGTWVLMTWFCKMPEGMHGIWTPDRTRAFFEAVPDDRVLALELWGENWSGTGWHHREGWYGKPWVWSILQSFGDRVDIYGGLPQIVENHARMMKSPDKGNIQGMGIMTEGLDYNPVVYELVLDMMWGDGVTDLDKWKKEYLLKRYGSVPEPVAKAWDILHATRYNRTDLVNVSPLTALPRIVSAFEMDMTITEAWGLMLEGADELGGNPAYQFDLVNLGREAMGTFAPYYTIGMQKALDAKDAEGVRKAGRRMTEFMADYDRLMGTSEHLLLGRWLAGARSWGSTPEDKALLEWGAKRQITEWGGKIGGYAVKEWSGLMTDRMIPAWDRYIDAMEESIRAGREFDKAQETTNSREFLAKWALRSSDLPTTPAGDPVAVSRELWRKYKADMDDYTENSGMKDLWAAERVPGLAMGKPVTATGQEADAVPKFAVDGKLQGRHWGALAPASLTVDLLEPREVAAFIVYPYRGDDRYYQYTIEVSADGENWMPVVDMTGNRELASAKGHFTPFTAGYTFRYARLNMLKNSVNSSVHVVEFKILSPEDMEKLSAK